MPPHARIRNVSIAALAAALATSGCLASSFVRTDGPAQAGGVTVALVDHRCSMDEDYSTYRTMLILGMRVSVRNDTPEPITVHPDQLRLMAQGLAAKPTFAPEARVVAPGATEYVRVEFQRPGDLGCDAELSLALDGAIQHGTQ